MVASLRSRRMRLSLMPQVDLAGGPFFQGAPPRGLQSRLLRGVGLCVARSRRGPPLGFRCLEIRLDRNGSNAGFGSRAKRGALRDLPVGVPWHLPPAREPPPRSADTGRLGSPLPAFCAARPDCRRAARRYLPHPGRRTGRKLGRVADAVRFLHRRDHTGHTPITKMSHRLTGHPFGRGGHLHRPCRRTAPGRGAKETP